MTCGATLRATSHRLQQRLYTLLLSCWWPSSPWFVVNITCTGQLTFPSSYTQLKRSILADPGLSHFGGPPLSGQCGVFPEPSCWLLIVLHYCNHWCLLRIVAKVTIHNLKWKRQKESDGRRGGGGNIWKDKCIFLPGKKRRETGWSYRRWARDERRYSLEYLFSHNILPNFEESCCEADGMGAS